MWTAWLPFVAALLDEHSYETDAFTIMLILSLLHKQSTVRNRNVINLAALPRSHESAWHRLLHGGNNSSFLCVMGVNHDIFRYLLSAVHPILSPPRRHAAGRPRKLDAAVLGLTLHYLNSTMRFKTLAQVRGGALGSQCWTS